MDLLLNTACFEFPAVLRCNGARSSFDKSLSCRRGRCHTLPPPFDARRTLTTIASPAARPTIANNQQPTQLYIQSNYSNSNTQLYNLSS